MGVRPRSERGLGERRHRPRHRGPRGREHPPLVGDDGCAALSLTRPACSSPPTPAGATATGSACGVGAPEARRRDGPRDRRLPLAARDEQVDKIEHRLFSAITQNWRASRSSVTRSSSSSSPRRLRRPASFAPTRNPSARTWGRGSQRTRPFTRLGGVGESACRIRRVFMTGPHPRPSGRPEDRHVRASPTR